MVRVNWCGGGGLAVVHRACVHVCMCACVHVCMCAVRAFCGEHTYLLGVYERKRRLEELRADGIRLEVRAEVKASDEKLLAHLQLLAEHRDPALLGWGLGGETKR